jgi:uncharacterized protein (DUF433 family)
VTADQLEMISTDPGVMHGQAVIAGTRVPVSVILDCLAAGMTVEEITAEYPAVTVKGVRAAAAYGAALAREELLPLPQSLRCFHGSDRGPSRPRGSSRGRAGQHVLVLGPEPIPADLFTSAASVLPGDLAARVADPLAWPQTLARLARPSLARIDRRGLQMHRLTQAILCDRLTR